MEKRKRLNYLLPHNNLDMRKPKIKFEKILTHLLARSLTPLTEKRTYTLTTIVFRTSHIAIKPLADFMILFLLCVKTRTD